MIVAPLAWPPSWERCRPKSRFTRFFVGVPFIGPQAGAFRFVCRQLASRNQSCLDLWGSDPLRSQLAAKVSAILKDYLRWPNSLFIPPDPFQIVGWDHTVYSVDHLLVTEAFMVIEDKTGAKLSDSFFEDCWDLPYGNVIALIQERVSQLEHKL